MTFEIQYTEGLTVSITVTSDPGAGASWSLNHPVIDWGDGSTTTGAASGIHSHTYSKYGTYMITYTATNNCGITCTDSESIPLWTCPVPTCIATITQTHDTLHLDASASIAGAGETIVEYKWGIYPSDGTGSEFLYGDMVEYIMDSPGVTYTVAANVTNSCGLADTVNLGTYSWTCPVPTCGFTIN